MDRIILVGNQVKIKEYVLLVYDVVVAFQIKNIFSTQVALLVEIIFDDEGHVACSCEPDSNSYGTR